ncbi:hypothetical protein [Oceanisphaera sp. IT1-181]|uniref:tetratricopeptide repeat protein n=1 Tax=Oceanisphaera sp. IT1-181 TaxID=3081199 RepID=UPI0029C9D81E|nr:hypothetical protein [Oceanisphaera sp. IT1-181]
MLSCVLALYITQGEVVAQDYGQAHRWFLKSAEQGFAKGQYKLAVMYYHGQGVELDYKYFHTWTAVAAANGLAQAELLEAQVLATEYI